LQLIQRFEAEDPDLRRDYLPVLHAVTRNTYRLKGNIDDSYSACGDTCSSGCYHGSLERFARGVILYCTCTLVDNPRDGRYTPPFCAAFNRAADQNACLQLTAQSLVETFEKSPSEFIGECVKLFNAPERCTAAAAD